MVSDINTPRPPDTARADEKRFESAAEREAGSARHEAQKAKDTVSGEASRLAATARDRAYEGAESGKQQISSNLNDFTAAIKKASDELGERDQSMAANLVREAASGLEQVSGAIEGRSVQDLTRSVAGFARRQPAAFLIGAALAGVALGRFAKASAEHDERDYADGQDWRNDRPARPAPYGSSEGLGYPGAAARPVSTPAPVTPVGSPPATTATRPTSDTPFGSRAGSLGTPGTPGPVTTRPGAVSDAGSSTNSPISKGGNDER